MSACCVLSAPRVSRKSSSLKTRYATWNALAPNFVNATSRSTTPASWSPSIPSSSARSKALERSICSLLSIASAAMPGAACTPTSYPSRQSTCSTTTCCPSSRLTTPRSARCSATMAGDSADVSTSIRMNCSFSSRKTSTELPRFRRQQSNGFIERLHRTLLDEHFRIQGRTKWYEALEEMQTDLDDYLVIYNTKRPHQGRNTKGITPYVAFKKGLPKSPKKELRKTSENTA